MKASSQLFLHCCSRFPIHFVPGIPGNQLKLGVTGSSRGKVRSYFFNDFVSQILYNKDPAPLEDSGYLECLDTIDRAAIVKIVMTEADAVVIQRGTSDYVAILTLVGGLLSLYSGFTFLSAGEVLSLPLRVVLRVLSSIRSDN